MLIQDIRFGINPAGDRAEVIDNATGRPLAIFDSRDVAAIEAATLNAAAKRGPRALAHALGAVED